MERERESKGSGIDFDKLKLLLGEEVDEGQERYTFTWPGKKDAIRQSQIPSTATLRPCVEKSRGRDGEDGSFDSDNIYIEGDNLEVLKLLQRGYHGKVKMIYIDPPYNTGHDFVYKDKFGDTIKNYKEQAGLANQSNADTSGRYHSDWCSMMYPRLRLARELLSDDGAIFISIDDNEVDNLRTICDEIFGESNFIAQTIRTSSAAQNTAKFLSVMHDYTLIYCKDRAINGGGWKVKKNYADEFEKRARQLLKQGLSEEQIGAELRSLVKYPRFFDFDHYTMCDEHGVYRLVSMGGVEKGNVQTELIHPVTHRPCKKPIGGWRYKEDVLLDLVAGGYVYFGKDESFVPNRKNYLSDYMYQTPKAIGFYDTQADVHFLRDNGIPFDFPKPVAYIQNLEDMIGLTNGDIVLDFFSGSATTAHALMNLNYENNGKVRFILVQLPELCGKQTAAYKAGYTNICQVGEERIRRAGDRIKAGVAEANAQPLLGEEPKTLPDIGFRVFTLDESGIEKPRPGELVLDVVKPDRSDLDIVFEMMLKWGLELTLPVEQEDAAGYPVYSVACGELVCCLADGLTMDALEAIADMEPRRVLMRDSILTDTLKLNAIQAFKRVGERTGVDVELRTV